MVGGMESPPPFDLQAYQPPISLWSLVEQLVSSHEKNEIKNMLGESLVEQSQELHDEILLLLDIWHDYRNETNSQSPVQTLPEPPDIRDRLVQEINFFVENVREKAKSQGINPEKLLSRHNTEVIDYAAGGSRPSTSSGHSRPSTSMSGDGRETPMVYTPTGSDRTSAASMLSEEVESMNDKLNVLKFDEVVQHLRQTLEEECEKLLSDITFLQQCLDDEATYRAVMVGILTTEPTITALREERTLLEKDLLSPNLKAKTSPPALQTTIACHLKKLSPTLPTEIKMKHLQGLSSPGKVGPIKALHNIQAVPHPPARNSHTNSSECMDQQSPATCTRPFGRDMLGNKSFHNAKSVLSNIGIGYGACSDTGTGSKDMSRKRYEFTHPEKSLLHTRNGDCHLSEENTKATQYRCEQVFSQVKTDLDLPKANNSLMGKLEENVLEGRQDEVSDSINRISAIDAKSDRVIIPVPPSDSRPKLQRPNTAERFRKMVIKCRDSS